MTKENMTLLNSGDFFVLTIKFKLLNILVIPHSLNELSFQDINFLNILILFYQKLLLFFWSERFCL